MFIGSVKMADRYPVIDSNQQVFLCSNPITDFKQESMVPAIIGFNSGEGGLFASSMYIKHDFLMILFVFKIITIYRHKPCASQYSSL